MNDSKKSGRWFLDDLNQLVENAKEDMRNHYKEEWAFLNEGKFTEIDLKHYHNPSWRSAAALIDLDRAAKGVNEVYECDALTCYLCPSKTAWIWLELSEEEKHLANLLSPENLAIWLDSAFSNPMKSSKMSTDSNTYAKMERLVWEPDAIELRRACRAFGLARLLAQKERWESDGKRSLRLAENFKDKLWTDNFSKFYTHMRFSKLMIGSMIGSVTLMAGGVIAQEVLPIESLIKAMDVFTPLTSFAAFSSLVGFYVKNFSPDQVNHKVWGKGGISILKETYPKLDTEGLLNKDGRFVNFILDGGRELSASFSKISGYKEVDLFSRLEDDSLLEYTLESSEVASLVSTIFEKKIFSEVTLNENYYRSTQKQRL